MAPTTTSSSSAYPPQYSRGDATIIAMLRAQDYRVQNIRSLILTVLDPSLIGYARWCDEVLLTLKCYELVDHVLSDPPPINDPAWDRMETVVLSCILSMIIDELQDIANEHGVTACHVWRTIEHQFIGNSETRALHFDTMFYNFVQGDLSVSDYFRKIKSIDDSVANLGCAVFDYNFVLNVLRGLNKLYDHLRAIITCSTPLSSFHKVRDDLVLKELTLSPDMPAPPPQTFYSNNTPAPPPSAPSHPLLMLLDFVFLYNQLVWYACIISEFTIQLFTKY
jgi:hypothetical protein